MLPLPPPLPSTTIKPSVIQLEFSTMDAPLVSPNQSGAQNEETETWFLWPWGIQHLAMALTQMDSLLEEPWLLVFIAKNVLRFGDRHHLGVVETDEPYSLCHRKHPVCILSQGAEQSSKERVWCLRDEQKPHSRGMLKAEDSSHRGREHNEGDPGVCR